MSFEPVITMKPVATKPVRQPDTRGTLRALNASREITVFRRESIFRRLLRAVWRR